MGPNVQPHNFEREPNPAQELVELRALAHKILNRSLTSETRVTLIRDGMPPGEIPTVGNMFEILFHPGVPLLERATEREREQWQGWAARLIALYRQHVQSAEFLSAKVSPVQFVQYFDFPERKSLSFSRSDFDVLSYSSEIRHQLGARIGGPEGPTLGRAFEFELQRCGKLFDSVAALSAEASRKLRET